MEKLKNILKKFKKTKTFKALSVIKNLVCWTLIVCLVITVIIFLMSRISGGVPSFFGYSVLRVSSGSMEPELKVGDVLLSKTVESSDDLEAGDIITFNGSGSLDGRLVTHKIIKAPYTDDNGIIMLQTKGVANDIADEPITYDSVMSEMVCKIPILDVAYNLFLSPWGLIIFLLLIVFVFFDEVVAIVRILSGHDRDVGDGEDVNSIIERLQAEKTDKRKNEAENDK